MVIELMSDRDAANHVTAHVSNEKGVRNLVGRKVDTTALSLHPSDIGVPRLAGASEDELEVIDGELDLCLRYLRLVPDPGWPQQHFWLTDWIHPHIVAERQAALTPSARGVAIGPVPDGVEPAALLGRGT
jgi:hypothetical protein